MSRRMKRLASNAQVLQNGDAFEQHVLLERTRQTASGDKVWPPLQHWNTLNKDFTAGWRLPSRDDVEQRGFAGSVPSNHCMALAGRHLQIQIADDLQSAEGLAQIPDFERAHRRFPISVLMVPRTPPRKNATTSMKKIPKKRLYSSVIRLNACLTTTKIAAPINGPKITFAPPMLTIRTPSPLICQLIESGLTK